MEERQRRSFTDEYKRQAAELVLSSGRSITSVCKELGLRDLVLAQVLCVVGSSWVGIAAKVGRAHVVFDCAGRCI